MRISTASVAALLAASLVSSLAAQPRIGLIDVYGRRKTSEAALRKALGVKEGDPLPRSKGDVEEQIEKIPGVVRARLEAACCDDGKAILYVGIEEKGAPHFDYNAPPEGLARLPLEIHEEYATFLAAVSGAVRAGHTGEDLRQGHSLMDDPGARKHQERFVELAATHLSTLKTVLATSGDDEHRAIAAYVLGYAPRKQDVVNDLQAALRDPDDTVRNNAMRALGAIAVLAARESQKPKEPDQDPRDVIRVSPTWFVEMLDSLIWPDRTTAAVTLVTLTETRNPQVLAHLKERAVPALLDMARWKHLPHALPAFILVGRAFGAPEEEIQKAWAGGDREAFLARLTKPAKK